ncbi:MAG: hypothetical protein H6709_08460 [Kofleriaceae bacterium]|nr:hypothetical protein [Kofleriaceae bacterium]
MAPRARRAAAGIALVAAAAACSGRSSPAAPAEVHDAAPAPVEPVVVPAPRPLGMATLDAFGYRRGPGRAAYNVAVKAEKRGDWQGVVDACHDALAADPEHLDAAWLLAAALARQGAHDQILAPLSQAVAGDWGKWGERSLTLPLFEGFRRSRWGDAYAQLAEGYRSAFAAAAPRALIVLGRDGAPRDGGLDRRTEVYGFEPATRRWLRLSRTGGTVVAALPAPGAAQVAYVAYRDLARSGAPGGKQGALARPRVAVIDLATGRVSREQPFTDVGELRLWWRAGAAGADPQLAVTITGGAAAGAWLLDWKRGHKKRPPKKPRLVPGKDALVIARGAVRRLRLPVADVTADWDDDGLASAIRLERTRRTVTPPAGLLVDGNALAWSPDGARLALVAVPGDDCAAAATVFVVDAATGKLRELGPAMAPAPAWLDATHVAYTAGDRVRVVDVAAAQAAATDELTSTGGVATAIVDRPCAPPDDEALFAPAPGDEPDDVGDAGDVGDDPLAEPAAAGDAPAGDEVGDDPAPSVPADPAGPTDAAAPAPSDPRPRGAAAPPPRGSGASTTGGGGRAPTARTP